MDLQWLQSRLDRRLDQVRDHLVRTLSTAVFPIRDEAKLHELEGILSTLWQGWNRYCRHVVMASCLGCDTKTFGRIAGVQVSEHEIAFIAKNQKGGVPPGTVSSLTLTRLEPTWGDMAKLVHIITALAPVNSAQLLAAFGTIPRVAHIQAIRNATAHRNNQAVNEIAAWQASYVAKRVRHPLEALFWTDPSVGKYLVLARIDDMSQAAFMASC